MEREGAEKAGVAGLMSGVQEMAIRREAENFEKRGWRKKMEKKSKSACPEQVGHAAHKSWPLAKGLPPSTGPCATKYSKKCSIELKQHCLTYLRDYSKSYLTCS